MAIIKVSFGGIKKTAGIVSITIIHKIISRALLTFLT
jgi:hypothetical protein